MPDFTGTVRILNSASNQPTLVLEGGDDERGGNLSLGGAGQSGDLTLHDGAGRQRIFASAEQTFLRFEDGNARTTLHLDGTRAAVSAGTSGNAGDLRIMDGAGRQVLFADGANAAVHVGASGNAGDVIVLDSQGRQTIRLDAGFAALFVGANGNEGDIQVLDGAGRVVFSMDGNTGLLTVGAAGNDGEIRVLDANGTARVRIIGSSGDISLSGADCAEEFEIAPDTAAEPGDVLVIEDDERLRRCLQAYDRRVAGVLSGAGDLRPGIVLDRRGAGRRVPVALAGKVVCNVDAGFGAIGIGDLLTTSPTPGHAMRAGDPSRAFGAVLGKALRGLPSGRGLLPVLVGLQ